MQSISGDHSLSNFLFSSVDRSVSINRLLSMSRPLHNSTLSQIALNSILNTTEYTLALGFNEEEMENAIVATEELFYKGKIEAFISSREGNLETPFRAIAYRFFKENRINGEITRDLRLHLQNFFFKIAEAPLRYIAQEAIQQVLASEGDKIEVNVSYSRAPKLFAEDKEGDSPALSEWFELAVVQVTGELFKEMEGFASTEPSSFLKDGEKRLAVTLTMEMGAKEKLKDLGFLPALFKRLFTLHISHAESLHKTEREIFEKHEALIVQMKQAVEIFDRTKIAELYQLLGECFDEASELLDEDDVDILIKEGKGALEPVYRKYAERLLDQVDIPSLKGTTIGEEIILLNSYKDAIGDIADVLGDSDEVFPVSEMEVIAHAAVLLNYRLESRFTITPCKWMKGKESFLCLKVQRDL